MVRVGPNPDQSRQIASSLDIVSLVDDQGNPIGIARASQLTAEQWELIVSRARSEGPWRSTTDVLARLGEMEQAQR